jgi:hypothetical protein
MGLRDDEPAAGIVGIEQATGDDRAGAGAAVLPLGNDERTLTM